MTQKREFYAATVEEAVAKAADELGVGEGELSYRVVDEGNSGFLGIGARDARIEIDAPDTEVPGPGPETPGPQPTVETLQDAEPPTDNGAPYGASEEAAVTPVETRGSGNADLAEVFGDPEQAGESVSQEVIDAARERVALLLDAMGFDARVDAYDAEGYVAVDVATEDTALFIGLKGETIDALQYLVNASVNKNRSERARIVLDAEGYRQRRIEALQGMAHRTARKALREDRPVELPPMNPAERRVVHLFLRDNPRVSTESEGSGDDRRVRISPT